MGESGIVLEPPADDDDMPEPEPEPDVPEPEPDVPEVFPTCGGDTLTLATRSADVVLVLDKSGSMVSNTWDHDRDSGTEEVTRWFSLHGVVENLVDGFDADLRMGSVLFPRAEVLGGADACEMASDLDAPVGDFGGSAVLDSMPDALSLEIRGGTPASAGVTLATEHLAGIESDAAKAIILVTDGAANCVDGTSGNDRFRLYDDGLEDRVAEAAALGIAVYVVGIDIVDELVSTPEANPFESLSAVALAGGAPRPGDVSFYDAFDQIELDEALTSIANEVGCRVPVEAFADDLDRLQIGIDGDMLPQVDVCDGGDGWRLAGAGAVELCPQTCDAAQAYGAVEATLSCIAEP